MTIDQDSTPITRHGIHEGAIKGDNPKRSGGRIGPHFYNQRADGDDRTRELKYYNGIEGISLRRNNKIFCNIIHFNQNIIP